MNQAKNLWLFVLEMHVISGVTKGDRGKGANLPPAKLNVSTGPSRSLYFGIYYSFRYQ